MQNFQQYLETPLSQKQKTFYRFFIAFLKYASNIEDFGNKRSVSYPNYFQSYYLRKRWLLEGLEVLSSEHHSVMSVLTGSKHCWNGDNTTINSFFPEFEVMWVGKSLLEPDLKSWDLLLEESLPMTSIPVGTCRISRNNFKRYYLKKKRLFLDFLLNFWNVQEI